MTVFDKICNNRTGIHNYPKFEENIMIIITTIITTMILPGA